MSQFERELAGIYYHFVRTKGAPQMLLRLDAAKYVTGIKNNNTRAREYFDKYLLFLCEPNRILNPSPRWKEAFKRHAANPGGFTDQISEHVCELLKRYYPSYQLFCHSTAHPNPGKTNPGKRKNPRRRKKS